MTAFVCFLLGHKFVDFKHMTHHRPYYLRTDTTSLCTICGRSFVGESEGHEIGPVAECAAQQANVERMLRSERPIWKRLVRS